MRKTRVWCDSCGNEFEWEDRGYEVIFYKDGTYVSVQLGDHPPNIKELCINCFKDIVATGDIAGISKRP